MASSKGHDSDRAPDKKQETWLVAVSQGQTALQAARTAGYKNPRSAAYDNLRSPLLQRTCRERFGRAGLDELAPYRTIIEAMTTATRTRRETIATPVPVKDETGIRAGERRTEYKTVSVAVPDWEVRLKAAGMVLLLVGDVPGKGARAPEGDPEARAAEAATAARFAAIQAHILAMSESERQAAYEELKRAVLEEMRARWSRDSGGRGGNTTQAPG